MTNAEAKTLHAGEWVEIRWVGAANGTDQKRASVVRVHSTGLRVSVQFHRIGPGGRYTGDVGRSVRSVRCDEILERHAAFIR